MTPLKKHVILGIHVTDRVQRAEHVQEALAAFGDAIRTRLGLHETQRGFCSPNGLILIELTDDLKKKAQLKTRLAAIKGVEVKEMIFTHP